jgi:glutamyl-tRNA synthetase
LNQQYILQTPAAELVEALAVQYRQMSVDTADGPPLSAVVEAFHERAATLLELAESSVYVFRDFDTIDPKAAKKHLRPVVREPLADVRQMLADLETWAADRIQSTIQSVADRHELGFGKLGQPLRVAVTGGGVSPPIDVTMALIGRDRCVTRIDAALLLIDERMASAGR